MQLQARDSVLPDAAATTRVLIDTQNGSQRWSAVGAGTNIIQASWLALVDSVEYGLCVGNPLTERQPTT